MSYEKSPSSSEPRLRFGFRSKTWTRVEFRDRGQSRISEWGAGLGFKTGVEIGFRNERQGWILRSRSRLGFGIEGQGRISRWGLGSGLGFGIGLRSGFEVEFEFEVKVGSGSGSSFWMWVRVGFRDEGRVRDQVSGLGLGLGFGQEFQGRVLGLRLGFRDKVGVGFGFETGVEFPGWGQVWGPREGASFMVKVRFRSWVAGRRLPDLDPET
ncbi:hypothetical protein TIFTF001_011340 [Ficus carica]|uniref:Uncharacterized protein n=1 Tax=Ficus carica TaxID=3494 RepID=A0AA88D2R7_FICCA|nr:hypothetical protein TIFTF001_011340 [Ficus carica]